MNRRIKDRRTVQDFFRDFLSAMPNCDVIMDRISNSFFSLNSVDQQENGITRRNFSVDVTLEKKLILRNADSNNGKINVN